MADWYRIDTSKQTWRECWRLGRGRLSSFAILAGCKLRGKGLPMKLAVQRPDTAAVVEVAELPQAVRASLEAESSRLRDAFPAFDHRFYQAPESIGKVRTWAAALLARDGRIVARVSHSVSVAAARVNTSLVTRFMEGGLAVVTDRRRELDPVPGHVVRYLEGASSEALVRAHVHLVRKLAARRVVKPVRPEELEEFLVELDQTAVDHGVQRGLYVRMSEAEVAALRAVVGVVPLPACAPEVARPRMPLRLSDIARRREGDLDVLEGTLTYEEPQGSARMSVLLTLPDTTQKLPVAMGMARLRSLPGSVPDAFLAELARLHRMPAEGTVAVRRPPGPGEAILSLVVLGKQLTRHGEGFSTVPGTWAACRVIFTPTSAELYLNVSPTTGEAEIAVRDFAHGAVVVRELSRVAGGG